MKDKTSIANATLILGVTGGSTGVVDVESTATFNHVVVTANGALDGIEVGQSGTSTLLLENGATMTGGSLRLGANGHTGTVDVETISWVQRLDGVAVAADATADTIQVGQTSTSTPRS